MEQKKDFFVNIYLDMYDLKSDFIKKDDLMAAKKDGMARITRLVDNFLVLNPNLKLAEHYEPFSVVLVAEDRAFLQIKYTVFFKKEINNG